MIKKNEFYKCGKREKDTITRIKEAIVEAPTLYSPYSGKYFLLYIFLLTHLL